MGFAMTQMGDFGSLSVLRSSFILSMSYCIATSIDLSCLLTYNLKRQIVITVCSLLSEWFQASLFFGSAATIVYRNRRIEGDVSRNEITVSRPTCYLVMDACPDGGSIVVHGAAVRSCTVRVSAFDDLPTKSQRSSVRRIWSIVRRGSKFNSPFGRQLATRHQPQPMHYELAGI